MMLYALIEFHYDDSINNRQFDLTFYTHVGALHDLATFTLVLNNARTSLDMNRTLTLIFTNSSTTQDIVTKISAFLQLT